MDPFNLVLLRHGESQWNAENRFTGWTDVDLTARGVDECARAAASLRDFGFTFDVVFTSILRRCVRSTFIVQDVLDQLWVPVVKSWRLNERHYGSLQGLNKAETAKIYGEEQTQAWRKSFTSRPPALDVSDPRHPINDVRFRQVDRDLLPATESLCDALSRISQCWTDDILPSLNVGKTVLVIAHGNTLRAVTKILEQVSDDGVVGLHIPTGVPIGYQIDGGRVVGKRTFGYTEREV